MSTGASTGTTGSGGATPLQGGVDGSGTPVGGTISLRSHSTNLLPTSKGESSGNNNHTTTTTTSAREAKAQAKEKEKKEKKREKERKEKEKKEREKEKEKKKKIQPLPALFAEVVLDGEVGGRTTVKRANPLFSSSASSTARPNRLATDHW
jgi:outer membrane biosynthesis protein TonB